MNDYPKLILYTHEICGDFVIVVNSRDKRQELAKVSRRARDGRVQIGTAWLSATEPDKYGRIFRELTTKEKEAHDLWMRQMKAAQDLHQAIISRPMTLEEITAIEEMAKSKKMG